LQRTALTQVVKFGVPVIELRHLRYLLLDLRGNIMGLSGWTVCKGEGGRHVPDGGATAVFLRDGPSVPLVIA
jgi:hypothetical protein